MKKFILLGLDRSGKTSVGELLSILSEGRLRFLSISDNLQNVPGIPSDLREIIPVWHKDRISKESSQERKTSCRTFLKEVYSTYAMEILEYNFTFSDIYAGLRDPEVIWKLSQDQDYVLINLWAFERLLKQAKTPKESAELKDLQYKTIFGRAFTALQSSSENRSFVLLNDGSIFALISACENLLLDLELYGYLPIKKEFFKGKFLTLIYYKFLSSYKLGLFLLKYFLNIKPK